MSGTSKIYTDLDQTFTNPMANPSAMSLTKWARHHHLMMKSEKLPDDQWVFLIWNFDPRTNHNA
jgi:hypothetical protein